VRATASKMAKTCCILLAAALPTALGFTAAVLPPSLRPLGLTALSAAAVSSPCKPSRVFVEADATGVKENVLERLEEAAASAIAERGHFAMAIPGGSVLKMLEGTAPSWASETTLAFVNHKAVDVEDAAMSTQAKANKLFLSGWAGAKVIGLGGSSDAKLEAAAYEDLLRGLSAEKLPRNADGVPQFDMMLIGVGDDGHVGSLYPGREELLDASGRWVLPVQKASGPGSITLSLQVMTAAKQVVVAACGVSEKYPHGKSDAMARAIEGEEDTAATFPAVATISHQSSIY
jgi:6-phosphogluconolactonase